MVASLEGKRRGELVEEEGAAGVECEGSEGGAGAKCEVVKCEEGEW